MKKFIVILAIAMLPGCAVVSKVSEMWPRDHDAGLVTAYINLQTTLDNVDCENNKHFIAPAIANAKWLNAYAEFRTDPQRSTTKLVYENLIKAEKADNPAVCKRWVNLTNINMKSIKNAWGNR